MFPARSTRVQSALHLSNHNLWMILRISVCFHKCDSYKNFTKLWMQCSIKSVHPSRLGTCKYIKLLRKCWKSLYDDNIDRLPRTEPVIFCYSPLCLLCVQQQSQRSRERKCAILSNIITLHSDWYEIKNGLSIEQE